jgi:glycosyltransferase involved in cell wall biosynthesis
MSDSPRIFNVLHYVGYDDDRGGIISVVRALANAGSFHTILGVNPGFRQGRSPPLPTLEFPAVTGEKIGLVPYLQSRRVAKAVRLWLQADPANRFHGHSRAGLLVALWLWQWGERSVVVSVHCYGRQKWFYRMAARRLAQRLYWLSPAMKEYYGIGGRDWNQCVPGCFVRTPLNPRTARSSGRLRLGGIGAIVSWKKWDLVLEALRQVAPAVRARLRFTHIGSTDGSKDSAHAGEELARWAKSPELCDHVSFLGQQESSADLLSQIDVLVVASAAEPFSVAMLEALAAGVPVLAADSGGAKDIVEDGRSGWFFESGSAADLARKLTWLVESDLLERVSMPPANLGQFSPEAVAAQWLAVYHHVGE